MVHHEPRPLYEAYKFLCNTAQRISSGVFINNQILRVPDCREEYEHYLELISATERGMSSVVDESSDALRDIFGTLNFNGRKFNDGTAARLFDIIAPSLFMLQYDPPDFDVYLNQCCEEMPEHVARALSPEEHNVTEADTREVFDLINRCGASQSTKTLLNDVMLTPEKYIAPLKDMLYAAAGAFDDNRDNWSELLVCYNESYAGFNSDSELLNEKFGLTIPQFNPCSIYPSITGFKEWTLQGNDNQPDQMICFVGVLYDRFRANAANTNNQAARVNHIMSMLGDPTRFNMFLRIVKEPTYGRELSKEFGLTPGMVSEHLRVLTGSGLINSRVEGRRVYYSINYRNTIEFMNMQHNLFLSDAPQEELERMLADPLFNDALNDNASS